MAYSPKLKGLFKILEKYNNHDIPMLVGGDFNLDLRGPHGPQFIEFMRTELGLQLTNDVAISTSRNSTCIDAVFSPRHIEHFKTREYISYFSTHRPLLSVTSRTDSNAVSIIEIKTSFNVACVSVYGLNKYVPLHRC